MRKLSLILLAFALVFGFTMIACSSGSSSSICNHNLVVVYDNVEMIPGTDVPNTPSGLRQSWRECTKCDFVTYPELPDGVQPPAGAVWLGPWTEDTAIQIKWDLATMLDIKDKVQSGELNRFYLYVDKTKIEQDAGSTKDGRWLSSLQMIVNTRKLGFAADNTWVQVRAKNYETGADLPGDIKDLDILSNPTYMLINHTEDFEIILWENMFQFFVQHSASGGGIYNLNPIAAFVGPGLASDPPPPDRAPKNVKVKINDIDQTVAVSARGGAIELLEGVDGFTLNKSANHRASYSYFQLDLGTNHLVDITEITFDVESKDASTSARRYAVLAFDKAPSGTLPNHQTNPDGSGSGWLASYQITDAMAAGINATKQTLTLNVLPKYAGQVSGSKVFLAIYEHNDSSAVVEYSNIKFKVRDPLSDEDAVAEVKEIIEDHIFKAKTPIKTQTAAIADVERILSTEMWLEGCTVEINVISFTEPTMSGTGSLTFTVTVKKGIEEETTDTITLIIPADIAIGTVFFDLATWHATWYNTITYAAHGGLNYITNSNSSNAPLSMNSSNPSNATALLKDGGKIELFLGASGQGINVNMAGVVEGYEIIVTGEYVTVGGTSNNGVLRLNNAGLGGISMKDKESGDSFELRGAVPAEVRIGVDGNGLGTTILIDSIKIVYKGL